MDRPADGPGGRAAADAMYAYLGDLIAAVPLDCIHWTYRLVLRGLVALPVWVR